VAVTVTITVAVAFIVVNLYRAKYPICINAVLFEKSDQKDSE
jgi:hypothetical protein